MSAGRPRKIGLDFAGWEVGVLDHDTKIERLIEAQGIAAFTVYFYLCQRAYATHGYYLDWDYSLCAATARKLGRGASAEFVKNVVDMCFHCCLFDKGLFDQHGILTSRGIQKRYWNAIQDRASKYESKKFWLLKSEESHGFDLCTQNPNFPPENPPTVQNSTQHNITLQDSRGAAHQNLQPPTLEEVISFCQERKSNIDPQRFFDYYTAIGWFFGDGTPIQDWKAQVCFWEKTERPKNNVQKKQTRNNKDGNFAEYEEMVTSYSPKYKKKES